MGPLLTVQVALRMRAALRDGLPRVRCSLDLQRSTSEVALGAADWSSGEQRFPYLAGCKDRTIYHWTGTTFAPVSRYTTALVKLVPTPWGPPTFEVDGVKMLPTARISPYTDAQHKVSLIEPAGKAVLDTCGGLGYFAAWCLQGRAAQVLSFEKNPDVLWLRRLNPWSPEPGGALRLLQADVTEQIALLPSRAVDAILHDPPRFGLAGELYSQVFYDQMARVLKPRGRLFHYVGTPNRLTSQRDVPREVAARLQRAGFKVRFSGDGVLAVRN
jgi:hypothetical protein